MGRWVASHASRSAGRGQLDDLQPQRLAAERPAVGPQRAGVAELELLGDVGHHAVVRGRRRAQHGDARGQPLEHLLRSAGSRAGSRGPSRRCSAPRRPPAARRARRTAAASSSRNCGLLSRSGLISSRSTASSSSSSWTSAHAVAVGRVDRVGADAEPLRGRDLVAHQRQQRRDDQRRPGALLAQQRRRDEVDGGLAPARALDAQHARAVVDQVGDGLALVLAEAGSGSGQALEQFAPSHRR